MALVTAGVFEGWELGPAVAATRGLVLDELTEEAIARQYQQRKEWTYAESQNKRRDCS
jgi:hypothetical protein